MKLRHCQILGLVCALALLTVTGCDFFKKATPEKDDAKAAPATTEKEQPKEPKNLGDDLPGLPDTLPTLPEPTPAKEAPAKKEAPATKDAPAPKAEKPAPEAASLEGKPEYSREVLDKALAEFIASLGELPAEVKNAEEPLKVLYYFTQAMAKDQQSVVLALLSEKALKERLTRGKSFGPTAESMKNTDVILGSVQYLNDDKGTPVGAHVGTTWRPKGSSDEGEQIAWVLRREANTWRVAGMISVVEPNYPPLVVNFENLDETAKQYAKLEYLIREHQKSEAEKAAKEKPAETAPATPTK